MAKFDQMLLDYASKGLVEELGFCPKCAKILVKQYFEEQDKFLIEGDPSSSCRPIGMLRACMG